MFSTDTRANVLANCKCLYGPDTEVFTLSVDSQCQAIAMRFDPLTASWTKFLHTKANAESTNQALRWLLGETEIELAKLFSANCISVPFSGDPVQTMTLHRRVQSHSCTSCSGRSYGPGFEFIATPESTSSVEAAIETTPDEAETAGPEAKTKYTMCETLQQDKLVTEDAFCGSTEPYPESEVAEEIFEPDPDPEVVEEIPMVKVIIEPYPESEVVEEIVEPMPEEIPMVEDTVDPYPEPEVAEEKPIKKAKKGVNKAKKGINKAKKGKEGKEGKKGKVMKIRTPAEEIKDVDEYQQPDLVQEAPVGDSFWGSMAVSMKTKKETGKNAIEDLSQVMDAPPEPEACFAYPRKAVEAKEEPIKEFQPEQEEPLFECEEVVKNGGNWSSLNRGKSEKKAVSFSFGTLDDENPVTEAELPVADGSWEPFFVPLENKKGKGKLRETLVSVVPALCEEPFVEILERPFKQAEEASITLASHPEEIQPGVTTHRNQQPAGQTAVLTILHTTKTNNQTLKTMINFAENTKAAILNAVNLYLDSKSLLVYFPGQRNIEIKFGAGKNGDLDLSGLEESKWPEYLEYLRQYTRLPELTVDVRDFWE